jgi:purine-cytosine permease-like protein
VALIVAAFIAGAAPWVTSTYFVTDWNYALAVVAPLIWTLYVTDYSRRYKTAKYLLFLTPIVWSFAGFMLLFIIAALISHGAW